MKAREPGSTHPTETFLKARSCVELNIFCVLYQINASILNTIGRKFITPVYFSARFFRLRHPHFTNSPGRDNPAYTESLYDLDQTQSSRSNLNLSFYPQSFFLAFCGDFYKQRRLYERSHNVPRTEINKIKARALETTIARNGLFPGYPRSRLREKGTTRSDHLGKLYIVSSHNSFDLLFM